MKKLSISIYIVIISFVRPSYENINKPLFIMFTESGCCTNLVELCEKTQIQSIVKTITENSFKVLLKQFLK